jgi:hypothetical protein
MSELVPVTSLAGACEARQGFDLAIPHPIMRKSLFLRLRAEGEWRYKVEALRAERHLILRDEMWVRRGEARLMASHASGTRVRMIIRIRPWKLPGPLPEPSCLEPQSCQLEQAQRAGIGLGARAAVLLGRPGRELRFRCLYTEREIEIRLRCVERSDSRVELSSLLAGCRCH